MSKWQDKSDFEINKTVASIAPKFKSCIEIEFFCNSYYGRAVDIVSQGVLIGSFDPCNNPSDAWPIILQNEIGINKLKCEHFWLASDNNGLYARDKNPLRAAMIVYLEMNNA